MVGAYDELKLRIESAADGSFKVLASGPVGEASGTFTLPFSDVEVENFVLRVSRPRGRRRGDSSATEDAKRFGAELFQAVFQSEVRDIYRASLEHTRRQSTRGLRITLCLSGAPGLMDVPWEYLYDDPDFLAVSAFTPVVRYLDRPRGARPLGVEPPLRILGVVASPSDYEALDVERERANLESALGGLGAEGRVQIDWLERPTLSNLLRRLQSAEYHVLHFVGHGSYDATTQRGMLLFTDDNGYGQPVSGDKLGMLLRDFTSLRLAVLNACEGARTGRDDPFSGVAASLVERDIPAVVAMQFEITDVAAVAFAEGFYRALASGHAVDTALAAARLAIFAERSDDIEWGTPVLFMRVADGRVFEIAGPPAPTATTSPAPPELSPPPQESPPPAPEQPVPTRSSAPAEPAPVPAPAAAAPPVARRGTRPRIVVGAAIAALAVAAAVIAVVASGGSSGPVAVGMLPGHSIGPVFIGEQQAAVTGTLTQGGWVPSRANARQWDYISQPRGNWVIGFAGGKVDEIQRYGDPKISIGGVSINSTVREARRALPSWQFVQCAKAQPASALVSPDRHTYWLLAYNMDARNQDGANGIIITTQPFDAAWCQ